MKQILHVTLLAMLLFGAGWAQAQEARIGIVDMRKVLNESKAGKVTKVEIEKMVKQRQQALERDEKQLEGLQQAYEKEKLLLSEAQKQAKQKDFDTKLKAFQQATAAAQRDLQKQEAEFMQKAIPEVRAIIADLAKQQKLLMVIEKNDTGVLYTSGTDLTEDVIKRLDTKAGG
jgi:outer membrane protein